MQLKKTDLQKIIDEIVREVCNRIKCQSNLENKMLIIGSVNQETFMKLNADYEIVHAQEECDVILITKLSYEMLSHLAIAAPYTNEEGYILKHLLTGKKVYVIKEGIEHLKYKYASALTLYTMFQNYLVKLEQYGIIFIDHISQIQNNSKKKEKMIRTNTKEEKNVRNNLNQSSTIKLDKLVLIEKDLLNNVFEDDERIVIPNGCIITPLAQDYIRLHRIIVERE